MILKDTDKEFNENDALQYDSVVDARSKESASIDNPLSNERSEATKGYISKFPFITWTLVAVIGIAFCFIHSHQESLWKWTGATAADAQSLQAKVVVSLFSAVIGGCLVAVLSKALVSVSFFIFRHRGASFSYLTTVIEGYAASRILTLVAGRRWVSSILIISILVISVVTKQIAVVSMGVEFVPTNNTKTSYTRNYTSCTVILTGSDSSSIKTSVVAQTFNAILLPNSTYTNEAYDSSIPLGLAGFSKFERVLPFAEASCVQFNSTYAFGYTIPPVNGSSTWQAETTLRFSNKVIDERWVNCTVTAVLANAISTCNDTKCETVRTSVDTTPFGGRSESPHNGLPGNLQKLFQIYAPDTSKIQNLVTTWLQGRDVLGKSYYNSDDLPPPTVELIEKRLAILGTVMARAMCDANYDIEENNELTTPITSNYIEYAYYQYRLLWRWPFYVLAGCIFVLWVLCMISMWLAPESRVLSIDWLLNQYISRHQHGYLSGADLLPTHRGAKYQVYDDNANGVVGNIVISTTESHKLDKYDRVIQDKQYQ